MVKTKTKNIHIPLVVAGYSLFILLVVATLISTTIPYGVLLFDPRVRHYNVAVMLIAFTIGALLPAVLAYVIGDKSIKSKSHLSHHFNGVVFGIFSYWLVMALPLFSFLPQSLMQNNQNLMLVLANVIPGIAVAIIASILAVLHIRSHHARDDVLTYKPFFVLLLISILSLPLWSIAQGIIDTMLSIASFIPLVILVIVGVVSYTTLRRAKLTRYEKIAWSAMSISVGYVVTFVMSQFVFAVSNYIYSTPTMEAQNVVSYAAIALALAGWIVYWVLQVRSLPKIA